MAKGHSSEGRLKLDQFRGQLRKTVALPVAALLLLVGALSLQLRGTTNILFDVERTDEMMADTQTLLRYIIDAETGMRGFQITRDRTFLQSYLDAQPYIDGLLQTLPGRIADPTLQSQVQQLTASYTQWRNNFAIPLLEASRSSVIFNDPGFNLTGKQEMDSIRKQCDEILRRENDSRTRGSQSARSQVRSTLIVTLLMALILGVALAGTTRESLYTVSDAYKHTLSELHSKTNAIAFEARRLETTLQAIGDGVIVCDAEGRVERINPVAQILTGWTQKEALGVPLETIFRLVNEETRKSVESQATKVKRLGSVSSLASHTILIARDGTECQIEDSVAPIRDEYGVLTGIVLVFRDVTQQRRSEDALQASQKLAMAGRLSATIAHEIHNPLDSVANLLYLLQQKPSAEEADHYLDLARQEIARVTQISRTMLSLYRESRIPVRVELKDLLQGLLLLINPRLAAQRITCEINLPTPVTIEGFPSELRQVFNNLIDNAAEAAGNDGEVRIELRAQPATFQPSGSSTPVGAIVEIADNGPGIPADTLPHLFQPFFTTKGQQGTGLGLWVSRGIVEKHGGTITVETETEGERHGSVLRVFLPEKIGGGGRTFGRRIGDSNQIEMTRNP